jgi:septal ring factor EnvC (AmiA/AmiB activator)
VTALQANLRTAQTENERLRAQLAQLKAENDQLRAQLASMNQTIASLNNQLSSLKAQLAAQLSASEEEGPNPLIFVLLAALIGIAVAFFIYRKKKAEE